jgi:hypothetical protein
VTESNPECARWGRVGRDKDRAVAINLNETPTKLKGTNMDNDIDGWLEAAYEDRTDVLDEVEDDWYEDES